MSKIITIYCEGSKDSYDKKILEKVIDGLSANIEIVPLEGIRGAKAIIQYIEPKIVHSDFKILFRDRDFDKPIPQDEILEPDKKGGYCYYSYRTTIESYLFDTSLFLSFLTMNNLCAIYYIHSEDDVKKKFIDAAEKIKYYQAVRHTMGKMRTGETNFGTKLTEKSGKLPQRLDEEFCKNAAWNKILQAKALTDCWTKDDFFKIYQSFINMFDKDFMENLYFLIYFHGKDFASSLKSTLSNFPLENYYKFAKKHFNYHQFPDLVQLRELIERNSITVVKL